jgi:ATP-dependent DNA ligase
MRLPITPPISAMEAKIQSDLPRGSGWQYEPKWDGFRALAFRDGDEVLVFSRNQRPLTRYFPELVPALRGIAPRRIVLDAEIVIFTGRGTDFDAMLMRIHPATSRIQMLAGQTPASLIAFDVLADGDEDFRGLPLRERRRRLTQLLGSPPPPVFLSPVTEDREVALGWLQEYEGTGLDGIVAKRLDDVYHPGERAMVKVKQQRTADCVVGGFRWGKDGKRVGSLLLGVYDGRHLEYIGHTSSFDDETRRELVKLLESYRGASDFGEGRTPGGPSRWATERSMEWEPLRPELVCEVGFDRLEGGRFRHGVRFLRWRPDKSPHECTYAALKREAAVELKNLFGSG